jgi:hypothetical protein
MTLQEFYDADITGRALSAEADYGVHWRFGGKWPTWRVSYIRNTGEIYAVKLNGETEVRILGQWPADQTDEPGGWYKTLDVILYGWAEVPHRQLSWVKARLARAAEAVRS